MDFTIDILDKLTEIIYMIRLKSMKYERRKPKFSFPGGFAGFLKTPKSENRKREKRSKSKQTSEKRSISFAN